MNVHVDREAVLMIPSTIPVLDSPYNRELETSVL